MFSATDNTHTYGLSVWGITLYTIISVSTWQTGYIILETKMLSQWCNSCTCKTGQYTSVAMVISIFFVEATRITLRCVQTHDIITIPCIVSCSFTENSPILLIFFLSLSFGEDCIRVTWLVDAIYFTQRQAPISAQPKLLTFSLSAGQLYNIGKKCLR